MELLYQQVFTKKFCQYPKGDFYVDSPPIHCLVRSNRGRRAYTLPEFQQLKSWWDSSPYYDIGIYLPGSPSGPNSANPKSGAALNADWVSLASSIGWGFIPIWSGL
jgi:hypothetical protein